jgi:hypothetical protein
VLRVHLSGDARQGLVRFYEQLVKAFS